ncbi:Predicted acylesterase/phospholipase RssA, contains patatin domain [Rhodospirillales bacterium URHD0017]|nr:Predicted acylesterase/phospholipase RssA, contains patatin domain [Rhodospirillales bacterium URHD0017]
MKYQISGGQAPLSSSRRKLLRMAAGGAMAASVPGCASPERGPAVPTGQAQRATVLGIPNERFFPASGAEPLEREFFQAFTRLAAAKGLKSPLELPKLEMLAISGGGENGAFGAGLLNGWTEQGTRPEFEVVTGISTGALTAPFAFLGPAYDAKLKSVYTQLEPKNVLIPRFITAAVWDDAMADNAPLYRTISQYLDEQMLAEIARAYDGGRLLLVASTDLDAQVPVIWNIGAIAKSGHPKAADTIRRVLLASAAIPGAFPPTMIDVTLDGKTYQEMHVDGGAFAQTFLYPATLTNNRRKRMQAKLPVLKLDAYIIRNGRLDAEWSNVQRKTLSIAGRAISTMTAAAGYNDVVKIYFSCVRDDVGFHLASMGSDFNTPLPQPFDPPYMKALYDYGYQRGRQGYDWASKPPNL